MYQNLETGFCVTQAQGKMTKQCKDITFVTYIQTDDARQMDRSQSHTSWCQKCPAISAAEVQK